MGLWSMSYTCGLIDFIHSSRLSSHVVIYASVRYYSRVVHGSDGPAGRVGSGRVTILPNFGGSGRVGSALRIFSFLLIISWYLNPYESSNTTFGLIDFLRYLIYNN